MKALRISLGLVALFMFIWGGIVCSIMVQGTHAKTIRDTVPMAGLVACIIMAIVSLLFTIEASTHTDID